MIIDRILGLITETGLLHSKLKHFPDTADTFLSLNFAYSKGLSVNDAAAAHVFATGKLA